MFSGLTAFSQLTLQLDSSEGSEKRFQQLLVSQIGNPKANLSYQLLFLFLIYIEYPMMIFLVIAGLDKMDIYHIVMLFFFVWYTLRPQII